MKKTLFSIAILIYAFASSQITLENTFPTTETVIAYSTSTDVNYISFTNDNKLKIYNSDYSLKKTVAIPIGTEYKTSLGIDGSDLNYIISKHIFNTDDKLEFIIEADYYNSTTNVNHSKLIVFNEDGTLLSDFGNSQNITADDYYIYNDPMSGKNKIIVYKFPNENYENFYYDVYSLPTTTLATQKLQTVSKLYAFPIPAKSLLKIINPNNNSNKVEVFDVAGKIVLSKTFLSQENHINLNIENLNKGVYFYKIGDMSSKFIKE